MELTLFMNYQEINFFFEQLEKQEMECCDNLSDDHIMILFSEACACKPLEIVKFFCENLITQDFVDRYPYIYSIAFFDACNFHGSSNDDQHLEKMKYLYDKYADLIDINCRKISVFILLKPVKEGKIEFVKFIVENFPTLNYKPHREKLLKYCFRRKYHEILYYLKSKYPDLDANINHKRYYDNGEEFCKWVINGCQVTQRKSARKV